MSLLTRTADTVYALRFLRLLTTPWKNLKAYKLGIIDGRGKVLKKKNLTADEKSAYNLFHRLVFNVKRLLNKIPFGKTTIASYIAALWLLKENYGISEQEIEKTLFEVTGVKVELQLNESDEKLSGFYALIESHPIVSGEYLAEEHDDVVIEEEVGRLFGIKVYRARHLNTEQVVFVTSESVL